MSIRLMAYLWDAAPFGDSTLLTLLAVAEAADEEGFSGVSMTTLIRKTKLSFEAVNRELQTLCSAGWLCACDIDDPFSKLWFRVSDPAPEPGT